MNLLLDTHTFLWVVGAAELLSPAARTAINDPANTLYLSFASVWELQIKLQLGKLALPNTLQHIVEEQQRVNGIQPLSISLDHIYHLAALPPHHRDPFDRLIIAQAIAETLTVVSADSKFAAYPISIRW